MQRFVIIGFLLCNIALHGWAQVNLVINPSIELHDTCPMAFGQLSLADGWDTLRNGGGNTPDLFNSCYSNSNNYCGVPTNWWNSAGYQFSKDEKGYAGLLAYPYIREIVQGSLYESLTYGKEYCVKSFVNLSNFSKFSISSIGFYLDDGQISNPWDVIPSVSPQVISYQQLNDTLGWIKVEGSFISSGTETYITITNFNQDNLSNPLLFNPSASSNAAYYYIDDVSVIDIDLPAFAGNDTYIYPGDSAFIGRTPEIGLNDDCVWSINGVPFDTIAGMWVKPDSATLNTQLSNGVYFVSVRDTRGNIYKPQMITVIK
ncbi:MAG: hypothetical protein KKA07_06080 [Bacteroidetes bacterium]|nr:hypothetical protein [Bacteroidota bacterium]MBU1718622.1 hypothetical protein [Bacteroidota bacterium]